MGGFPDWQRITEWIGAPLATATALAIGAGSHTDGPFPAGSWSSVVVSIKPTGGSITATVRQFVAGGPATLFVDTVITCPAGVVTMQTVPLIAANVSLIMQGSLAGETVDYALCPANTTQRSVTVGGTSMITGIVSAVGGVTAGTGFAVAHSATGVYAVTFTTAFPAAPTVAAVLNADAALALRQGFPTLITANGFTFKVADNTLVARDEAWNFVAVPVA